MTPENPNAAELRTQRLQKSASAALYALLVALALWTVRDFIPAVIWALVIGIALWPTLEWLERKRWFRQRPTSLAALLTVLIGIVFVVPFVLVAAEAGREAHDFMQWVQSAFTDGIPMPDLVNHLPGGAQISAWWQNYLAAPLRGSPALKGLHSASAFAMGRRFGGRLAHSLVIFGFMLVSLFFLFRAGSRLGEQLNAAARRAFGANGASLARRMAISVRSTVTGLVVVGLGEGALLGIAYLIAGVPHAALLGMLTALAAMLPFCAPLVFIGSALWLLAQGSTIAAVCLTIFGFIVVLVAEHFVRPALISGSTRLPFLLVLFGILGGAETFGLLGLFIGPALMTILTVLWVDWVH
ncbi:MAG: AI-2E family transporter [Janthinobacterium lividum]